MSASGDSRPSVPLSGAFYNERSNAVELAQVNAQRARSGQPPLASLERAAGPPRRVVLDEGMAPPTTMPIRLPEALVNRVGALVREAIESAAPELMNDFAKDSIVQQVVAGMREVDVTQLRG